MAMGQEEDFPNDVVTKIGMSIGEFLTQWGYKEYGGRCPGCGHGPLVSRHIGILPGHTQVKCPCHAYRERDNIACGCVWSRDE